MKGPLSSLLLVSLALVHPSRAETILGGTTEAMPPQKSQKVLATPKQGLRHPNQINRRSLSALDDISFEQSNQDATASRDLAIGDPILITATSAPTSTPIPNKVQEEADNILRHEDSELYYDEDAFVEPEIVTTVQPSEDAVETVAPENTVVPTAAPTRKFYRPPDRLYKHHGVMEGAWP